MREVTKYMNNVLNIGRIPYWVCAPFFAESLKTPHEQFKMHDAHPSELNSLLANQHIDLAPTSSIEGARHSQDYLILPDWCTSCKIEVKSVLLFSNIPWSELSQKHIYLTPASSSSVALLKILLHEDRLTPELQTEISPSIDARLEIGDNALLMSQTQEWTYTYDLAGLWFEKFQLPFVFAVWLVHKKAWENPDKQELIKIWHKKISSNIQNFRIHHDEYYALWKDAFQSRVNADILSSYFENLDYHFTSSHQKSLELFWEKAFALGLCPNKPQLSSMMIKL